MTRFLLHGLLFLFPTLLSAGELETREFHSSTLDQDVKMNVLLPDGYKEEESRRYPAIYLLHGYGGDFNEWKKVGVVEEAAKLPVIIVLPEGDKSFYVNHHEDAKARWEDYITKDVVEYADKNFRTQADREHRGISGLSMGGYGAMVLGLRHPELFASIASHSGALGVPGSSISGEIGDRLKKIFGPDDAKERQDYDIFKRIQDLPAEKRPHIYIDCGSRDFLLDANRKLVAHLATLKVDYEYREVPGGHEYSYWKANVRYSLTRQLEALKAAEAARKKAGDTAKAGIAGTWKMILRIPDQDDRDYDLRFQEDGAKLKGTLISPRSGEHDMRSVSFADGVLRMEIEREILGNNVTFLYEGKLEGQKLSGKVGVKEVPNVSGEWFAERKAEEAPAKP
jgi:S-formylglutathione hydrolase FrmB